MQGDEPLSGTGTDACEWEQSALLRQYVLSAPATAEPPGEWHSRGPRSLSPFSPCAASRIPHIFAAARLSEDDVLFDLGCGDGRVLHEAAARFGCRCVGIEVDEACLVSCREGAEALGPEAESLFRWELADIGQLPDSFFLTGELPGRETEPLPAATVVMIFITGHGLVALSDWLHRAWRAAREGRGVRILTCVEALDTALDYNEGLFAETNRQGWAVYRDPVHAKHGVFVVPPYGCSLEQWSIAAPRQTPLSREWATTAEPVVLRGLLTADDIASVVAFMRTVPADPASEGGADDAEGAIAGVLFGSGDEWMDAEDAVHGLREHRVTHLHRECLDQRPLRRIRGKLLRAMYKADAAHWILLPGRSVYVRSFEHHSYEPGGSVADPEHRDDGSLLTISVLLGRSDDCEGGILQTWDGEAWQSHSVQAGDGVIFVSEKRHNVTPIVSGTRQSVIMELWEGGLTRHNRHR
mmetsp:Transcript_83732/g.249912  ORF Transcript_83732/g.249912 Transcript_83732/m.249912 type:complete len:468 (+) Transcript_83732:92-1495(+)